MLRLERPAVSCDWLCSSCSNASVAATGDSAALRVKLGAGCEAVIGAGAGSAACQTSSYMTSVSASRSATQPGPCQTQHGLLHHTSMQCTMAQGNLQSCDCTECGLRLIGPRLQTDDATGRRRHAARSHGVVAERHTLPVRPPRLPPSQGMSRWLTGKSRGSKAAGLEGRRHEDAVLHILSDVVRLYGVTRPSDELQRKLVS